MELDKRGAYSKALITDRPIMEGCPLCAHYEETINCFPNQVAYVYSFEKKRMVFAKNWKSILGYRDEDINMMQLVEITSPKYRQFAYEINDKALRFLSSKQDLLTEYSFTVELEKQHADGSLVPLYWRVVVLKEVDGRVAEIFGLAEKVDSLRLGNVMNYAAYGPETVEFEESLSKELFHHYAISKKELDAVKLAAKGYSFKEIAQEFGVSQSAIEKRILPLYKRFDCKSLTHLVNFAHENRLL
ncbi:MAG: DNA-binding CsgD family transcriptional regulator [Patiriisocius sp.]|jgi:DNA-binding CsgD family transcriptional regulator